MRPTVSALVLAHLSLALAKQVPLSGHARILSEDGRQESSEPQYFEFDHDIKRVAVIGAGVAGLQTAAVLVEHGLEVRLFERRPNPGGNWYYQDSKSVPHTYPNKPVVNLSYTPDIPDQALPYVHVYEDGEDGVTNDYRLREHWAPSAIWNSLRTVIIPSLMKLPNIDYPDDTEWRAPRQAVQRHVRQYASSVGLNTNDEEHANSTSYSTRVEKVHKPKGSKKWTLTLRKLEQIPSEFEFSPTRDHIIPGAKVRAEWWTEEFDAVVVASREFDGQWVPAIPNLDQWATHYPSKIIHSKEYRRPEGYKGKKILLIGGFLSSSGIATDIAPYASSICVSIRHGLDGLPPLKKGNLLHNYPANTTFVPEIVAFSELENTPHHVSQGVAAAGLLLSNGTEISGYDEIIFATGYRRSHPFLADYYNSTIVGFDEPKVEVPPIVTDGTHLRSLHWTGHYIADPTLALTPEIAWTMSEYQALGFAKVWTKKARLPSQTRMWATYPGAGKELAQPHGQEEWYQRLFIQWLNNESIEFGGRLVGPYDRSYRQPLSYWAQSRWHVDIIDAQLFKNLENTPRSQWPARNIPEDRIFEQHSAESLSAAGAGVEKIELDEDLAPKVKHWAELQNRW